MYGMSRNPMWKAWNRRFGRQNRNIYRQITGSNRQYGWKGKTVTPTYGSFYSKGPRTTGGRALYEVRKLRRQVEGQENRKSIIYNDTASLANGVSEEKSLITMVKGETDYLREENQITLKSIAWRVLLRMNPAEDEVAFTRMVIVYDREPRGAQATWQEVLHEDNITAFINREANYRGRFQILHDETFTLAEPSGGKGGVYAKGFIKLKDLRVIYDANVGDITDVQRGNLFVMYQSKENSQVILKDGHWRLFFVDKD